MAFKVLIVDDDEDIRELLQNILDSYLLDRGPFEITSASDGLEALNACYNSMFDLIVCDIKMPRMDGLTFLGSLRDTNNPNQSTWAIILSGYIQAVDAAQPKRLENSYFLQKPFSKKSITLALDIWMASKLRHQKERSA